MIQTLAHLQSCTALQSFGVEFFLSPSHFELNNIAWTAVCDMLAHLPLTALDAVSINFFAGQEPDLSSAAIGQLDWDRMREVLSRFTHGEREAETSITIFANTGFMDEQINFIIAQLPEAAESEMLYINGGDIVMSCGMYDELAEKMLAMEDDVESDAASRSESDGEVNDMVTE